MQSKKCYKCKENKSIDYFHKNKGKKDGHNDYCKDCMRLYIRSWIHTPNYISYWSKYIKSKKYKDSHLRAYLKWVKNNPEKLRAHQYVSNHNLIGDICEKCKGKEKLHAHHPDYSKPEKIITLCYLCHSNIHNGII